jgi:phosphoribosyl 1,2-cyclic phosphodiesterase
VRLTFLGVRGSTPAPGAAFVRFGGHTSCIAVAASVEATPILALDAGTGLRSLTGMLNGAAFEGTILLSHLHWDHVQGLPFFNAGDRDDSRVDLYLPEQDGLSGRDLLAQFLSPPAFPITPEGLRGTWSFHGIAPSRFTAEGIDITAVEIAHKGGRTYGYRLDLGGASVAYAPDHAPAAGVSDDTLEALDGIDVLIHDAQFLEPERRIADDYGHATVGDAVALAEKLGAHTVVLFHHGPTRTDDALGHIADGLTTDLEVIVAREGMTLDVTAR